MRGSQAYSIADIRGRLGAVLPPVKHGQAESRLKSPLTTTEAHQSALDLSLLTSLFIELYSTHLLHHATTSVKAKKPLTAAITCLLTRSRNPHFPAASPGLSRGDRILKDDVRGKWLQHQGSNKVSFQNFGFAVMECILEL